MKAGWVALAALLLLGACGGHSSTTYSHSYTSFEGTGIDGGVTFVIDGITVEPDGGVAVEIKSDTTSGLPGSYVRRIEGHEFEVSDGRFRLGGRDYGEIPEGVVVRVQPGGVYFGDEHKGGLPE